MKREKPLSKRDFQSAGKMSAVKDDGLSRKFVRDDSAVEQQESSESSESALDQ